MRLLLAGDLHIGRRSSRVDPDTGASAAAAWQRLVQHALARQVHVVLLSGDLVDRNNRFFEAVVPLREGIRRLTGAGVHVAAVSGNHDHDVLPRIADEITDPRFHFLGRAGTWSDAIIEAEGERLRLRGWSFPAESVTRNPVSDLDAGDDALPTVGIVHGDLGVPTSRYAPLALGQLRARPERLWLLGHIHTPACHTGGAGAVVLYPGSPQALDPGETGLHGVWEAELRHGVLSTPLLHPLSSAWYGPLVVDATDAADEAALEQRVLAAIDTHVAGLAQESAALHHAVLRVRITGTTPLAGTLARFGDALVAQFTHRLHDVRVVIDGVTDDTLAPLDLAALAEERNAIGALAHLLRELRAGHHGAMPDALVRRLATVENRLRDARAYRRLTAPADALPEEAIRQAVERQAARLLVALVAQRGAR